MSSKSRNRGRILTPEGLARLQQAIRTWEMEHEIRCTQEKLRELTIAEKPPNGMDPGTISKILEAEKGVDPKSIRCLFKTLGLKLDETDLVASSHSQLQVDPNFVGREGAIADLNALVNRDVKVIVIQARGGVGKTTLARKYLQQAFDSFLEFPIAKETKDIASIESLIEEKLRQLGEEPGREFFVSLDRLKRKLQNERLGILIDNLEPALDSAGKFIELHRRYVELLRVLADPAVRSVTFVTSRERLNEYSVSVQHYLLGELSLEAWNQFFQNRFAVFAGDRAISEANQAALAALHKAYGGNAKAMDILCGAILTDYAGNITSYWQVNQDDLLIEHALEDLVVGQFDRLQQTDVDAYNLLCRMGCYRYQDVPTVPIEGLLCLLWDVPGNRQKRVVKALQERSLVEFKDGEFWLHPIVREKSIELLRNREDWRLANQKAANYWTEIISSVDSINDAIKAFEGYYHLLAIQLYEESGIVILKTRKTMSSDEGQLDRILCRLGLTQQVVIAINLIIDKIDSKYYLSRLYDSLAVAYRMIGDIRKAIGTHEKSLQNLIGYSESLTDIEEDSRVKKLKITSSINIGICKMNLWELKESLEIFSELNDKFYDFGYCNNIIQSCLFFLKSHLIPNDVDLLSINENYQQNRARLFTTTGAGYRLSFLGMALNNLGEYDFAIEVLNEAMRHSKHFQYAATEAISLNCLGVAYRQKHKFKAAVNNHLKALSYLKHIGSSYYLAETHYQLGVTYQVMGEVERSQENFREATYLFHAMEAPRQIERVKRSIQNPTSNSSLELN